MARRETGRGTCTHSGEPRVSRPFVMSKAGEIKLLTQDMVVTNSLGMHLRPSQRLVQTVLKFSCEVYIQKEGHRVNAKSIMGLLTLAASCGARLSVSCEGEDAEAAMEAIRRLIDSGFGEE